MTTATTGYDVIVIGVGGMGSAAAYHLAARGQRVLGLEKFTPAHNRGSSHGGSRIVRQSYFEDPAYVPLLLRSYELWAKLAADSDREVIRLTGGLYLGPPDSLTVAGSLRASREWSLPHELLDAAEIKRRFPNFNPAADDIGIYESNGGFARPELTVQAHIDLALRAGATLSFGEEVIGWAETDSGVTVTTARATYHADQLLICPGAWAPKLLAEFGIPITIERHVLYWFDPIGGTTPFADEPIYIAEDDSGMQIYGFPAIDGPTGGVKTAFFRKGTVCTPETIDRVVHPHEIDAMRDRVAALLPAVAGPCVHTATCMYSTTPDEHFVIARHPGGDRITIACGFSGHGFKFVPVVGEILADLVIDTTTKHPIALFDPQRLVTSETASHSDSTRGGGRATGGPADLSPVTTPALIPTLGGKWYVDDSIFAAEQEQLFERMWFCAIRTGDLAHPGQFKRVQVGRESVLIVRGRDGALRAFLNICRHRGAMLCTEDQGQVRRNLQCPYHAWTYGLDGKLVAAPNMAALKDATGADIDRVAYGLIPVALREWLGYAWVCLADEPPSFEQEVMGAVTERLGDPAAVDAYEIDTLAVGRRVVYDVAANWKLIVENFMECYHCATIHPELTEVLPEFAEGLAAQVFVGHGAEFGADIAGFTVDGSPGFERLPGVTPDQDRRYFAITVRPTVFVNLVPDHIIFHRMFPMSAHRTIVECDWLYTKDVVAAGRDVSRSVELFHRVNEQDFAACERTQPAMSSRAYRKGGVLVPAEHHIAEFHEWLSCRIGDVR